MKRLTIRELKGSAITVRHVSTKADKLVYIMSTDKKHRYSQGRSRIAYIGTTRRGIMRMTRSVATRADGIFEPGVDEFNVHIVTCRARKHVKTWHKLERALILIFREIYGEIPHCNTQGTKMKPTNEFTYFRKARLITVIENLS